jgi:hypothetical protein
VTPVTHMEWIYGKTAVWAMYGPRFGPRVSQDLREVWAWELAEGEAREAVGLEGGVTWTAAAMSGMSEDDGLLPSPQSG